MDLTSIKLAEYVNAVQTVQLVRKSLSRIFHTESNISKNNIYIYFKK